MDSPMRKYRGLNFYRFPNYSCIVDKKTRGTSQYNIDGVKREEKFPYFFVSFYPAEVVSNGL